MSAMIGCDKCCSENAISYAMPIGGGGNVILCRPCWASELEWRKERNLDLDRSCRFTLPSWPGDRRKGGRTPCHSVT